ncbi:ribonuclease P protein component [Patescibacteria group bacterium]
MLARKHRLTGKSDFNKVQQKGKLHQFEDFGLVVLDKGKGVSRFGFVVSTKISKEAVGRNRIKRALSEAVRINNYYVKEGLDVVFLAKSNIVRKTTDVIMKDVRDALKKARLLK